MQENFVMRKNVVDMEQNLTRLAESLRFATQQVDDVCKMAVSSIHSSISAINDDKPTAETSRLTRSSTRTTKDSTPAGSASQPKKNSKAKKPLMNATPKTHSDATPKLENPIDNDDSAETPLITPKIKKIGKRGFYGTAQDTPAIVAVEERRCIVISHIDPTTTADDIMQFIQNKTEIEDARCTLLLPKGRELLELDFVSFKVSVKESCYTTLMNPEVWPARVLIRDYIVKRNNNKRRSAGFPKIQ
jgi:hypothetical protein